MVDVAEVSEKVENIADAGASSLIEVFDNGFVFVFHPANVCIFSNDETVGEHVNIIPEILSYISEILNTLLQMIDETFYKTLAYMCLQ